MIDITRMNKALSPSEMVSLAISRMNQQADTGAIMVYLMFAVAALRGDVALPPDLDAKITATLQGLEPLWYEYQQDMADNEKLKAALAHEQAQRRLAIPALDPALYPDVDDGAGNMVASPALATDTAQRAEAQAVIDAATAETLQLVADRLAARGV